jgi:Protein of unknown function (DUF732)
MLLRAVLFAGAIAAVAIGSASPAHAAPVDDFIGAVHADGITAAKGDDGLVRGGQAVCQLFDVGASRTEVYRAVYENTALSHDFADKFVNDAVTYLCPWQNSVGNG